LGHFFKEKKALCEPHGMACHLLLEDLYAEYALQMLLYYIHPPKVPPQLQKSKIAQLTLLEIASKILLPLYAWNYHMLSLLWGVRLTPK